jgi:hypothetical protein
VTDLRLQQIVPRLVAFAVGWIKPIAVDCFAGAAATLICIAARQHPVFGKIMAKIAPYAGPVLAAVAATGVFTNVLGSAYGILARSFLNR